MLISTLPAKLPAQARAVLGALADREGDAGLTVNELSAATALPTGHIGRHLRTLERERLARYQGGAWQSTPRGRREAPAPAPQAA